MDKENDQYPPTTGNSKFAEIDGDHDLKQINDRLNDLSMKLEQASMKHDRWPEKLSALASTLALIISLVAITQQIDSRSDAEIARLEQLLVTFDDSNASVNQIASAAEEAEMLIKKHQKKASNLQLGRLAWGFHRIGQYDKAASYYQAVADGPSKSVWETAAAYRGLAMVQYLSIELGGPIAARKTLQKILELTDGTIDGASLSQRCQLVMWWEQNHKAISDEDIKIIGTEKERCSILTTSSETKSSVNIPSGQ